MSTQLEKSARPTRSRLRLAALLAVVSFAAAACGPSETTTETSEADSSADAAATTDAGTGDEAAATDDASATADDAAAEAVTTTAATTTDTAAATTAAPTTMAATTEETTTTMAATTTTEAATTTSTTVAPTTTAGPQIAPFDNDSQANPAQSVFMRPTGTRSITHTEEISYPDGDQEDWIEFELPNGSNSSQRIKSFEITCTLSGNTEGAQLQAEIIQDGSPVLRRAFCGSGPVTPTVDNSKLSSVRIYFGIPKEGVHGSYTLTVVAYN